MNDDAADRLTAKRLPLAIRRLVAGSDTQIHDLALLALHTLSFLGGDRSAESHLRERRRTLDHCHAK